MKYRNNNYVCEEEPVKKAHVNPECVKNTFYLLHLILQIGSKYYLETRLIEFVNMEWTCRQPSQT